MCERHVMAGLEEDELLSTIAEMKEAGYSYKEISKRTGITPMAVRSRWRRMTGTHLKGARSASEAASKPGARPRRRTTPRAAARASGPSARVSS